MKFIRRLPHTARDVSELQGAKIGWDVFWCRDYSSIDSIYGDNSMIMNSGLGDGRPRNAKGIYGYTFVLAVNIWFIKFLSRKFIRVK